MLRARVRAYDFFHIFQILHICRIFLSFPSSHFLFFLHYYPS